MSSHLQKLRFIWFLSLFEKGQPLSLPSSFIKLCAKRFEPAGRLQGPAHTPRVKPFAFKENSSLAKKFALKKETNLKAQASPQ